MAGCHERWEAWTRHIKCQNLDIIKRSSNRDRNRKPYTAQALFGLVPPSEAVHGLASLQIRFGSKVGPPKFDQRKFDVWQRGHIDRIQRATQRQCKLGTSIHWPKIGLASLLGSQSASPRQSPCQATSPSWRAPTTKQRGLLPSC